MNTFKFINMEYLLEISFGDEAFILEILQTSTTEFSILLEKFKSIKENNFDNNELYFAFHKFKPTAIIYKLDTQKLYEEFGSNQNKISWEEFNQISSQLMTNLEQAITEINTKVEELKAKN